jgi:DNA modification methylase
MVLAKKNGKFELVEIGPHRLYLGDCRDVLPTLAPASVTLLWTDPPYGHSNHDGDWNARLNEHRGINGRPIENDDHDSMREVVDAMLSLAVPVLRPDCCCCCCCGGGGPRPTFAWVANRMDTGGLTFFHSVIWDKVNPGLGWRFRRQHEMVMVAHREGGTLAWRDQDLAVPNVFRLSKPREVEHPNEKPEDLCAHFVELHAGPGDVVLDPFMGVGTTGVAATKAGCKFVGIEIDPAFFAAARARIWEAYDPVDFAKFRNTAPKTRRIV